MKNNKNKILAVLVLAFMVIPVLAIANGDAELPNPLGETKDIGPLAANLIKVVLGLVGVLALVMFIYGGILWMTSGGNEQKIKKGKDTLVWATLGLAIIFFSYAIVNFVLETILTKVRQ
ncbi:MAG: pilin [Patescibacteria group bacterium]